MWKHVWSLVQHVNNKSVIPINNNRKFTRVNNIFLTNNQKYFPRLYIQSYIVWAVVYQLLDYTTYTLKRLYLTKSENIHIWYYVITHTSAINIAYIIFMLKFLTYHPTPYPLSVPLSGYLNLCSWFVTIHVTRDHHK